MRRSISKANSVARKVFTTAMPALACAAVGLSSAVANAEGEANLEERVTRLEQRVLELTHLVSEYVEQTTSARSAQCERPVFVDSQGIRRVDAMCIAPRAEPAVVTTFVQVASVEASTLPVMPTPPDPCRNPFVTSVDGVRRVKTECASVQTESNPCPVKVVGSDGVVRVRTECAQAQVGTGN